MVRPVCRDTFLLSQKSTPATPADLPTVRDLVDTLEANRERCVGMAANMIGVNKRIIAVETGIGILVMYNPAILRQRFPYETEEGCLSLTGVRKTTRFREIEVTYVDAQWKKHRTVYTGDVAQIIQHEVDHTRGILI